MKILSFLLVSILTFGTIVAQEKSDIQEQVRTMGSFDRIKASKGINVTLIEGEKESVRVTIRNGELSDVITELDSRELVLKMKTKIYKDMAVQVYVTYKTLREIDAGSGASVDADNTIYADKLKISAGTDSSVELEVDANAIEVNGAACRIELSGVTKIQEVSMGTGGKYYAYPLESKEAIVRSTLGSNVQVLVKEKLTATAGSGGTVNYKGEPAKVEAKENTGGKVKAGE